MFLRNGPAFLFKHSIIPKVIELSRHYPVIFHKNHPSTQWIGLRENLQETIVFTINYKGFLWIFPSSNSIPKNSSKIAKSHVPCRILPLLGQGLLDQGNLRSTARKLAELGGVNGEIMLRLCVYIYDCICRIYIIIYIYVCYTTKIWIINSYHAKTPGATLLEHSHGPAAAHRLALLDLSHEGKELVLF